MNWTGLQLLMIITIASASSVHLDVYCTGKVMEVQVPMGGVASVALEKWGTLPGCQSSTSAGHYVITLPLTDDLPCGTTRIRNKIKGGTIFYHRVIVTEDDGKKKMALVKCDMAPDNSTVSNLVKRNVLPPEFAEPDFIEITSEVSGTAPIPILGVGVKQNGAQVDGEINVIPGTPLTMEVFLDSESASTYGILVSHMEVTDTKDKEETIVFNGCSLDPYLFENFVTTNGDFVSAKFRAFKFPESSYVLFRGTVDICLDKCRGIACSNGELGYGRRRRGVDSQSADPNKIFEVTMMTFIKVVDDVNQETKATIAGIQNSPPASSLPWSQSSNEDHMVGSQESHRKTYPEDARNPPNYIIYSDATSSSAPMHFLCIFVYLAIHNL